MSDREALRSMLVYAQREADILNLPSVAKLLSQAVADVDRSRLDLGGHIEDCAIRADAVAEAEFAVHFGRMRLQ